MRTEIPITVLDAQGNPILGATVAVTNRVGGAAAPLYLGETGATVVGNPTVTDAAGRVNAWVDRGSYAAVISAPGLATYTEPFESAPASDGGVDTAWLADLAVTAAKIAVDTITAAQIAPSAIGASELADGVITAVKSVSGVAGNLPVITTAAALAALTPFDGMEVYFLADATAGLLWKLRYRAAASTFKWEVVQGGGLYTFSATDATVTQTAGAYTNTGISLTLPLAGDYDIENGGYGYATVICANCLSYTFGATAAQDADAAHSDGTAGVNVMSIRRKTGAAAAATVVQQMKNASAVSSTIHWSNRWLRATPVRVG